MPNYEGQEFDYTRKGMNEYLRAKRAGGAIPVSREEKDEWGRPLDEEGRPLDEDGNIIPEPPPKPTPIEPPPKGPSMGRVIVKDKEGNVIKIYPTTPNGIKAAKDHAKRIGGEIFHELRPRKKKKKKKPQQKFPFKGKLLIT